MRRTVKRGDTVKLHGFMSTAFTIYGMSHEKHIGQIYTVRKVDPLTGRCELEKTGLIWDIKGLELIENFKQGDKVLVSNNPDTFKDERYEYDRKEGDMHIVKNPLGFRAFKYVQIQK